MKAPLFPTSTIPQKLLLVKQALVVAKRILDLYSAKIEAPRIICSIEVAEMLKYCEQLIPCPKKLPSLMEVGQFCHCHGIDSQEVMSIFCQTLN